MSARGADTFTAEQKERLSRCAEIRFIAAPEQMSIGDFFDAFADADVAGLTPRGTPRLDEAILQKLQLQAIAIPTTGHEWINTAAILARGITLAHVPDFSSDSAAEFTWGLILALARRICVADLRIRFGRGSDASLLGMELRGRRLGVLGLGAIGSRVARIGTAFGMEVSGCDLEATIPDVASASFHELLTTSDILTLHVPLTKTTHHLIGKPELMQMKKHALLVNTARPSVVDVGAVPEAIEQGPLGGYAFDLGYESISSDIVKSLAQLPNVIAMPHISWYTGAAVKREIAQWVDTLVALATGRSCPVITHA